MKHLKRAPPPQDVFHAKIQVWTVDKLGTKGFSTHRNNIKKY
jgi:hypothetical protein